MMIISRLNNLRQFRILASRARVRSGGWARIFGTVKTAGSPDQPVMRIVYLVQTFEIGPDPYGVHNATIPIPVAKAVSDPITGEFEFPSLSPGGRYHAIAYDHTGQYDPVIKMNLTPTVD